jgi:hypothetical protein
MFFFFYTRCMYSSRPYITCIVLALPPTHALNLGEEGVVLRDEEASDMASLV